MDMKKNIYQHILLFLLSFALASCATGPSHEPKPVPAGYLYEGRYINVRVPNSNGWHIVSSSPAGMEFARSGAEQGESFGAQVLMFPLAKTQSEGEFVTLIQKAIEADTDSRRFSVIESDFQYSKERRYPCVSVESVVEDKQAQISPTQRQKLLLQSNSLYCRHPVRQETGFSIVYSHRGKAKYSNMNAESEDFISGVQVPGH
jgi:hypothetical protein